MRLVAISDLHVSYRLNRAALDALPHFPDDWLILAGDVGEQPDHLVVALEILTTRFARVIWVPGNHDLWVTPKAADGLRGQARYERLVEICRTFGVVTPEDPYLAWPGEPATIIVPMFLLFDYTFRPPEVPVEHARQWARERAILSADERMLAPDPWPSLPAWCDARVSATEARLALLPASTRTVLINHWPLRYDLARPPRIPRYSVWCGTTRTEGWGVRFRARAVVNGHLHLRTRLWRDGVRYDEVSLGYPRDWKQQRGIAAYLREILPDNSAESLEFVSSRDPYIGPRSEVRGPTFSARSGSPTSVVPGTGTGNPNVERLNS